MTVFLYAFTINLTCVLSHVKKGAIIPPVDIF